MCLFVCLVVIGGNKTESTKSRAFFKIILSRIKNQPYCSHACVCVYNNVYVRSSSGQFVCVGRFVDFVFHKANKTLVRAANYTATRAVVLV